MRGRSMPSRMQTQVVLMVILCAAPQGQSLVSSHQQQHIEPRFTSAHQQQMGSRVHRMATSPASSPNRLLAGQTSSKIFGQNIRGGGRNSGWELAGLTLSLIKVIVGSGVLCLSGGLATATDSPSQLLPAVAASLFFAVLSAYTFALAGMVCSKTGATSYGEAWARTVSPSSAWLPQLVCASHTAILCALYSIIVGDLAEELAAFLHAPAPLCNRSFLLVLFALTVQLPLCLLRSLVALSYSSFVGVCGILYTIAFMGYRYAQGHYRQGGRLWQLLDASKRPSFGQRVQPMKSVIILAMLNTCYQSHFAAASFFRAVPQSNPVAFKVVTYAAFTVSAIIGCLILSFGFLTFGGASQPLILNSFATADPLAVAARSATLLSILAGYPLLFRGFASGLAELMALPADNRPFMVKAAFLTVFTTTVLAMVMRDLGLVCAVAGALFGSGVIYIFPTLMHCSLLRKSASEGGAVSKDAKAVQVPRLPYYSSILIMVFGGVLGVLGVVVPILQAYTSVLD